MAQAQRKAIRTAAVLLKKNREFYHGPAATPFAGVIFDSAGNLYGATVSGGTHGYGTVFKLAPVMDGKWVFVVKRLSHFGSAGPKAYRVLQQFRLQESHLKMAQAQRKAIRTAAVLLKKNREFYHGPAATPFAGVIFDSAGNLYGATVSGGTHGYGTVFKLAPVMDGKWVFSILHSFDGTDGNSPESSLIIDASGNLYGTTQFGGNLRGCSGNGCGVMFEITP